MGLNSEQLIESIVGGLIARGPYFDATEATNELTVSDPAAIHELAIALLERYPKGGTFFHSALSYLPETLWPELVPHALDAFAKSEEANQAAESIVAYGSLQAPEALHPHLDRIFELRPNAHTYYEIYPWRNSRKVHFEQLRQVVDSSAPNEVRQRAWLAMLQTRDREVIEYAIPWAESICPPAGGFVLAADWLEAYLLLVGFTLSNGTLERVTQDALFHLCFPQGYFDEESRPLWLKRTHPTWSLRPVEREYIFGGQSNSQCLRCEQELHRIVVLDPIPATLAINRSEPLELAVCLSCLGWEVEELFYAHDAQGRPSHIAYSGPVAEPQFSALPLKKAKVSLCETKPRWRQQDWALSNSRENLNRLGGEGSWVQDAVHPQCPNCHRLMDFLMQLDSDLPQSDGNEWMWGSGGIGYVFWCDQCRVSAYSWQCT